MVVWWWSAVVVVVVRRESTRSVCVCGVCVCAVTYWRYIKCIVIALIREVPVEPRAARYPPHSRRSSILRYSYIIRYTRTTKYEE